MVLIYCWLVVLSAFQTIKKSQRKTTATTTFRRATLPGSMSMFSVSSLKDGIQRAIGCTPPPPYEVGRAGHSLFISRFALRSPRISYPWIAIALALIWPIFRFAHRSITLKKNQWFALGKER